MGKTIPFAPSPSHHHFDRCSVYHSQSWVVYIALTTWFPYNPIFYCLYNPFMVNVGMVYNCFNHNYSNSPSWTKAVRYDSTKWSPFSTQHYFQFQWCRDVRSEVVTKFIQMIPYIYIFQHIPFIIIIHQQSPTYLLVKSQFYVDLWQFLLVSHGLQPNSRPFGFHKKHSSWLSVTTRGCSWSRSSKSPNPQAFGPPKCTKTADNVNPGLINPVYGCLIGGVP